MQEFISSCQKQWSKKSKKINENQRKSLKINANHSRNVEFAFPGVEKSVSGDRKVAGGRKECCRGSKRVFLGVEKSVSGGYLQTPPSHKKASF